MTDSPAHGQPGARASLRSFFPAHRHLPQSPRRAAAMSGFRTWWPLPAVGLWHHPRGLVCGNIFAKSEQATKESTHKRSDTGFSRGTGHCPGQEIS
jgi:hypothetical protein